jgi:hypothetical protein
VEGGAKKLVVRWHRSTITNPAESRKGREIPRSFLDRVAVIRLERKLPALSLASRFVVPCVSGITGSALPEFNFFRYV